MPAPGVWVLRFKWGPGAASPWRVLAGLIVAAVTFVVAFICPRRGFYLPPGGLYLPSGAFCVPAPPWSEIDTEIERVEHAGRPRKICKREERRLQAKRARKSKAEL